jgi:hypothetical protein
MPRTVQFDKGLGWMPDRPSGKDLHYSAALHDKLDVGLAIQKPHLMAPRFRSLPIFDQESRNNCVGQSTAREWARERKLTARSAAFAYWYARLAEGEEWTQRDEGAFIRFGFDGLRHEGCPRDDLYEDTDDNRFIAPPQKAELDAEKRLPVQTLRIGAQASRESVRQDILACIASGHGFVTGVTCYDSFFSARSLRTGLFLLPNLGTEKEQGGHALNFGEAFLQNTFKDSQYAQQMRQRGIPDSLFPEEVVVAAGSWSTDYLLNGYHYFDINYVVDRSFTDDTWTPRAK